MTLAEIRQGWDRAAREDAMFNILTELGKAGGGWDPNEFFARGKDEISDVFRHLGHLRKGSDRALDFGCGVGRLTQALANYYEHVDGVDASNEMVKRAKRWNEHGDRVHYVQNRRTDLSLLDPIKYDLIYSVITLQHMPQELQRGYIVEFVRLLRKDGLAVFQVPEHNGDDLIHPQPWLSMYGTSRETVQGWVSDAGGIVVDVEVSEHGGSGWTGYMYTATRA